MKDFIQELKNKEELIEVDEFVNPQLEITDFIDRISKMENGGKAILFKNTGTELLTVLLRQHSTKLYAIPIQYTGR